MKKKTIFSTAVAAGIVGAAYYAWKRHKTKFFMSGHDLRAFEENVSEPFGTKNNIHPNNIILSERCSVSQDAKKSLVNGNVLVIDTDKKRKSDLMAANILQKNSSYIVCTKDGELYEKTADFLKDQGYRVLIWDPMNPKESCSYNPFMYLKQCYDENDIVQSILESVRFIEPDSKEMEGLYYLLCALTIYLRQHQSRQEQTMNRLYFLLHTAENGDTGFLDNLFEELQQKFEKEKPDEENCSFYYFKFKEWLNQNPEAIKKSLVKFIKELSYLGNDDIMKITSHDDLAIERFWKEPTALFIITRANGELDLFTSILGRQLMYAARTMKHAAEDRTLRVYVDEFTNKKFIKNSVVLAMGMAKISFFLFADNLQDIFTNFHDDWEVFFTGCESVIFSKAAVNNSRADIAKIWGCVLSRRHGQYQMQAVNESEVKVPYDKDVLVVIRGHKMLYDRAYRIEEHPDAKRLHVLKKSPAHSEEHTKLQADYIQETKDIHSSKRKTEVMDDGK